jgi:signal peptidase
MHLVSEALHEFKALDKRMFCQRTINVCLLISTALMTWKFLMLLTFSASPVVVVLSGSMEPAYYRGDILFLELWEWPPIDTGDVVVYSLSDRDIPIVHRIVSVHEEETELWLLTKGDNNNVNDRGLYRNTLWIKRSNLMGRVRMYLPYVGIITIWLNDYPILKYLLVGSMVLVGLTSREPQN